MEQYRSVANLLDNYYENNLDLIIDRKRYKDDRLKSIYNNFKNNYSPEKLMQIPRYLVLEKVFDNVKADYYKDSSLVFKLIDKSKDSIYKHLGSISFRSNHLAIFRSGLCDWKIGFGFPNSSRIVETNEAADFAFELLQKMCKIIIANNNFADLDDYKKFSNELSSIIPVHSWLHKYLHMIMPDSFPQFHTREYKLCVLELFGIDPIDKNNDILLAGQIEMVFHNMKHNHFYENSCLIYTIPGFDEYIKDKSQKSYNKNESDKKLSLIRKDFLDLATKTHYRTIKAENVTTIPFNYGEDAEYIKRISDAIIDDTELLYEYIPTPVKPPEIKTKQSSESYKTDIKQLKYALTRAEHKCEFNNNHWTFQRRTDNLPYTEPHHLIPKSQQAIFDYSLDVPANIVSLCSSCHNLIHYGKNNDRSAMLITLFNQRKDELEKAGICIDIKALLKMYGI